MANNLNMSLQKGRKRVRMRTRLAALILLVVVLQLLAFLAVLGFGGVFRELDEYSRRNLVEKTESSSTYIRNELQQKPIIVQRYAKQLNAVTEEMLHQQGAALADLQRDRALDDSIIHASAEILPELLRQTAADVVYLILESGELYADESGETAKAALYLRNSGTTTNDLLMVLGADALAEEFGFMWHADRQPFFVPDPIGRKGNDFYATTLRTALANTELSQRELGYWSGFSAVSPADVVSMKFTLPLLAEDGTAYGVLGIGLTENSILSSLPSYTSLGESAGYVLGFSDSEDNYTIQLYAGAPDGALLGRASALHIRERDSEGVCEFEMLTDVALAGNVQDLGLYGANSPYADEHWALISVAERAGVFWPLLFLQRMLLTAALLSLIVTAVVTIPSGHVFVAPLADLANKIRTNRKNNEVVRFAPSNIYEIDEITDAVTQMQISVHGFSSQVSKMISIADVGLGTFMYNRADDSVFVGQSLIKVLGLNLPQGEDIVMRRAAFLESIANPAVCAPISEGMEMPDGIIPKDFSRVYEINQTNGSKLWLRLGFTYAYDTAIGIVQDITATVMEKNRIEYERDYDHLTGLLNRHAYYRRVEKLFHDRSQLNITAFVMLDLDNLKYVNDTYGHNFGDDYIKTAANALKLFLDYGGIVSRLSGDEFSVCLHGFSSKEAVREIINTVRSELLSGSCLLADGTHFKVSGSMGVAWYPDDSDSREQLMKYADFAMYTVKHATKGGIAEFDRDVYSADAVLLTGVEEMNRIIEERSVKYAFQSIVSAKTGEIYGYEALMRVQSEIFRSPLELLRTAKTGAKLYEIERLTLTKSLEDFQALTDAGIVGQEAHIFINSIANNRLGTDVENALEEAYAPMLDRIVIEILEGESSDEECTAHKAELLRKWGAQLALDDFGTGYNSEYALLRYRPNIVKIDRSIVNGCDRDTDRRMIIESLVKLARAKGILVLAEGVETAAEMETVISCGVDLMQGYYLARPLFEPEPLGAELAETIRRLAAQQ